MRLIGRFLRKRALFGAALLVVSTAGLASSGAAPAAEAGRTALALGDSVTFGFISGAGHAYGNANNFVGYPEYYGRSLHMQVANPACPGETSGSLIVSSPADNGCYAFRHLLGAPLHETYSGSQLDFAKAYIKHHPETRLVTLLIGANDGFLLQKHCLATDPAHLQACILAGIGPLQTALEANIGTIIDAVRAAGFHGRFVLLTYYSLDYSDSTQTGFAAALNTAILAEAAAKHTEVADEFAAFYAATSLFGHNPCLAALLNPTPSADAGVQQTCDVHPSQSGQALLANTVVNVVRTHDEE